MSGSQEYKKAGVDTEAGQNFVQKIKEKVHSTHNPRVIGGLGGFGALYDASFLKNYKNPILVSGTDGVGTKLELARLLDKHDTIGIDLVAMCVNDLLVVGARPLFFLDYISCGKLNIEKMDAIISGMVVGCRLAGAALVGGETAEHPGLMKEDEYDLAGFAVGVVEKEEMITGENIREGDIVLGIESSGPHSNGYSLLRRLYLQEGKYLPNEKDKLLFIIEYLMQPTKIYVEPILKILQQDEILGMVHITGGGFYENIPRILPPNVSVKIELSKFPISYTFNKIIKDHSLDVLEMFGVFNMGIGFVLICKEQSVNNIINLLHQSGEKVHWLGKVIKGNKEVIIS